MPSPHVSVVLPAYNAEAFLAEAMQSVLEQSEPDLELIVIDDGSTDRTAVIANAIVDPRVRVISTTPSGRPAVPRNLGIRLSRAPWIAFLDADDAWPPSKLAVFREASAQYPDAGLYFSNGFLTDREGQSCRTILPLRTRLDTLERGTELLVLLNYVPLSSVMVRRDLLGEHAFDPRRDLRAVEDYLLWLQLNQRTAFHYIPQPLLYKRVHADNISADREQQLRRIHILLDTLEQGGDYPADLIGLARTLYDARYRPSAATRLTALLEVGAAFVERPVRTVRRLAGVLSLARVPRRRPAGTPPSPSRSPGFGYRALRP